MKTPRLFFLPTQHDDSNTQVQDSIRYAPHSPRAKVQQGSEIPMWTTVRLGNSGLKVSRLILGTEQYGDAEWQKWVLGEKEAIEHIKFAFVPSCSLFSVHENLSQLHSPRYDAGIQTFDTANIYSNGLSEIILGNAIKQLQLPREEIVILTKVYGTVAREYGTNFITSGENTDELGYVNQHGLSRKHIFDSVKASLNRLGIDYIDVLQCHRFDYEPPIEETVQPPAPSHNIQYLLNCDTLQMQALHEVVKAGYVRYIGMSSCHAYQFHQMQSRYPMPHPYDEIHPTPNKTDYAITRNLTPFISMQNHHSLLYREEEREMFSTLKLFGVGAIPWSSLARGLLTRPLTEQTKRGETDWFIVEYRKAGGTPGILKRVEELANKKGLSMAQIALLWSLSKEGVTAPIVGTTSLKKLDELIAVAHMKLTEAEMKYLEEQYIPQGVIGHSHIPAISVSFEVFAAFESKTTLPTPDAPRPRSISSYEVVTPIL
ncbi:hypothetical protein C0995_008722 [Termitomyces sp. Mi166|nr:hypothetical protein C0995_008722 [Termitomyces sp. Mi166\